MNKFVLLAMLFPVLAFCSPDYVKYSTVAENRHSDEVCKKYGLEPYASGGGMMFDVELVIKSFISHQKLNLAQARRLYVFCTQNLLNKMNSDKVVRPYLRQYPFQMENLTYSIHFQDNRSNRIPTPFIGCVTSSRGSKVFYIVQDGSPVGRTVHEETYDEALRIVQEETLHLRG